MSNRRFDSWSPIVGIFVLTVAVLTTLGSLRFQSQATEGRVSAVVKEEAVTEQAVSKEQVADAELMKILEKVEQECACAEGRKTPIGAYVTCMDCRVEVGKVLGRYDSKFSRTHMAGCVLSAEIVESLRLTVIKHDVRIILVLDHTDCAVRALAQQSPDWRFEHLQKGRAEFDQRLKQIHEDKVLTDFFQSGRLVMIHAEVDIKNGHRVKILRKFGMR